jgi:hypothetical protein
MTIYLYHKRHRITGLNYFGKTTIEPYVYNGSGKYWRRHLNKHGIDVETVQVWEFTEQTKCTEFALKFSIENNIVESRTWANLKIEDGKDGGDPGPLGRKKMSEAKLGKKHTLEQNLQKSMRQSGVRRSPEYIAKKTGLKYKQPRPRTAPNKNKGNPGSLAQIAAAKANGIARIGIKQSLTTCPHCGKIGGSQTMPRWHFDNCKMKG